MKVLNFKDYDDENSLERVYTLDENVQVDTFINIVRSFENEQTKMSVCNCQSFDDDGHPMYRRYKEVEEIRKANDFPNPSIRFYVEFCDRVTNAYKFNLEANVNMKIVRYVVDKKKQVIDSSKGRSR